MATGVLVLGVERATRLLGHLMLTEKVYDATVRLGVATTTDDAEGDVVATADAGGLDQATVHAALEAFVGDIEQVPSAVSAIKVDGRRAYKRVRGGEQVDLPARSVTVHQLRVGRIRRDGDVVDVPISVRCSSGTYIRALARDLGQALGVGGHLVALRRTAVGPFTLTEARTLDDLPGEFEMQPISEVSRRSNPNHNRGEAEATAVRHGRPLQADLGAAGPVAVLDPAGELLALYRQAGPEARAVAVFV
jgi:tRNA pseudouridine55 synthase